MSEKHLKILMITPALNVCGGIESFVMSYYRKMDLRDIRVDFLTHEISDVSYYDEIRRRGSRIFLFPRFTVRNLGRIRSEYRKILKNGKYDVVHCNMANAGFLYLGEAGRAGVPVRMLHSHQDKASDKPLHAIRNIPLLKMSVTEANAYVACSEQAGEFLFGKKKFMIIPNLVDYDKYRFDADIRKKVRQDLGMKDSDYIIGHTGRLSNQKNQAFLVELMPKILKKKPDAKLMLVGDGENEDRIRKMIAERHLEKQVLLLGARDDVNELLQAMDVFAFPSLYEGLGISVVEAQVSGLPCVCSTEVNRGASVSDRMYFIPLADRERWIDTIVNAGEMERSGAVLDPKYDLYTSPLSLEDVYRRFLRCVRQG